MAPCCSPRRGAPRSRCPGELPIFHVSSAPEDHLLELFIELSAWGDGEFDQYVLRPSYRFSVKEGKPFYLDVLVWERGDYCTPIEQRPAIRFLERI